MTLENSALSMLLHSQVPPHTCECMGARFLPLYSTPMRKVIEMGFFLPEMDPRERLSREESAAVFEESKKMVAEILSVTWLRAKVAFPEDATKIQLTVITSLLLSTSHAILSFTPDSISKEGWLFLFTRLLCSSPMSISCSPKEALTQLLEAIKEKAETLP